MNALSDVDAFERLYRAISPALYRFVRYQERTEVDDICADVWESASTYIGRFEGDDSGFEALVYTIARRRISDVRRRRSSRRTEPVEPEVFHERAGSDAPDAEAISQLRTAAMLEELVAALTPVQVDVVVLRVIFGLSDEHVGELLGRSRGNVRIIQHRALKRLRTP